MCYIVNSGNKSSLCGFIHKEVYQYFDLQYGFKTAKYVSGCMSSSLLECQSTFRMLLRKNRTQSKIVKAQPIFLLGEKQ